MEPLLLLSMVMAILSLRLKHWGLAAAGCAAAVGHGLWYGEAWPWFFASIAIVINVVLVIRAGALGRRTV